MKKPLITLSIIGLALSIQTASAQLAKKQGVTLDEISKEINTLAQKGDDASKNQMLIEAKALAESKDETFVNFGVRIYNFLEKTDEAEKIEKSILKKFPKGLKARSEAYETVFEGENITAAIAEKNYNAFLKKFPPTSFNEKNRSVYGNAEAKLATLYFKENNVAKANEFVNKIKNGNTFIPNAYTLSSDLIKENNFSNALPILEEAIIKAKQDEKVGPNYLPSFYASYGKTLYETGNYEKAIQVLEEQLRVNNNTAGNSQLHLALANSYIKTGNELDAFLMLEKFTIKNGKNKGVEEILQSLYGKLNNGKGDYNQYISKLDKQIKEAHTAKYKSEMIKKEAPNFSLVNLEGKTISLADLKGKVVVLDFWATWCGPCKISFPGMQAAVNKYKDDKEVEFLFIDTWQKEKNFDELVRNFIAENKYTFNVLFDEMKDRSKSVTTSYGVNGIPHKVVIDKEGFIRFESSGGIADVEKIVNEMETKIELARKG